MTQHCMFIVPGKPVAKARARTGKGFSFTPQKTVNYENWVKVCARKQMNGRPPFSGPIRVSIEIEVNIPQSWSKKKQREAAAGDIKPTVKPDADNVEKSIFDACSKLVWLDDKQIVEWSGSKKYSGMPQVRVVVEEL